MVRPLRIEYPGAVYHITSRGDRREPIAKDDTDRVQFLEILGQALQRFDAQAWAYCLMGNHYHLVLRTKQANLSRLMRQINGVYTQAFNRRHGLTGHLFQGRYKAILVDSDSYLLQVCRYVDLNPVRARMVKRPDAYAWSSYCALVGLTPSPEWLDIRLVHTQLAPDKAAAKYAEFVAQGHGVQLWDEALRQQIYLGDEDFIARMQKKAGLSDVSHDAQSAKKGLKPKAHQARKPQVNQVNQVNQIHTSAPARDSDLQRYAKMKTTDKAQRNQHIADAFYQGGHSQTAIAIAFNVSSSTVSRVVAAYER
jgi:putative transposase